jgi:hypothetical protein
MLDDWEEQQAEERKKREENTTQRERKEFLSKYANATKEELISLIFDHQKRLEKLEDELRYISSRSQQF